MRQVVRILMENAIRYTPLGGPIDDWWDMSSARVTVHVRDTGLGIAVADQERVFDRFFRSDAARSREIGGSDLGLPIARMIVTADGGQIGLTSEPGAGTDVWFTLPLGMAAARQGLAR